MQLSLKIDLFLADVNPISFYCALVSAVISHYFCRVMFPGKCGRAVQVCLASESSQDAKEKNPQLQTTFSFGGSSSFESPVLGLCCLGICSSCFLSHGVTEVC